MSRLRAVALIALGLIVSALIIYTVPSTRPMAERVGIVWLINQFD